MKLVAQHLFVLFVIKRTVLDLFSAETRNTFLVHHVVFFPSTGLSTYHLSQVNQGRPCTITHRIYLRLCDSDLTPISPQLMSSYNHFSQQKDCLFTTYALRGFSFPLSTTVSFWCCYFFYRLWHNHFLWLWHNHFLWLWHNHFRLVRPLRDEKIKENS